MKNKKRPIRCNHHFEKDDTTSSGEFICSYFIWMTPNQQKQRAEELNKMTKKKQSDINQAFFGNDVYITKLMVYNKSIPIGK